MRRIILILTLLSLMTAGTAMGQGEGLGLGIILGEPSGISVKNWLTYRTALDFAVAWSFSGDEDALHLHGDYLVHSFDMIPVDKGQLPVYYGIGGRVKFMDDVNIAVRVPFGIDYFFENAPVDLFLELVPMLELAPDTEFELNGGLGVRYFF